MALNKRMQAIYDAKVESMREAGQSTVGSALGRKAEDRALADTKWREDKQRAKTARQDAEIKKVEEDAEKPVEEVIEARVVQAVAIKEKVLPVTLMNFEVGNYYTGPPVRHYEMFTSQVSLGMDDVGTIQFQLNGRTVATMPYWVGTEFEPSPGMVQYMTNNPAIKVRLLTGRTGRSTTPPNAYGAPPVSSPYALPPGGGSGYGAPTSPSGRAGKGWGGAILEGMEELNRAGNWLTDGLEEYIFGQTFDDWIEGF